MRVRMIPLARREMMRAAQFYERRALGLGNRFLDDVRAGLLAILQFPAAHPLLVAPFRRKLLSDFPYALIYRVESDDVVVVAVAHFKRRPGYWRRRIET